jgi:bacteriocin-like protein
MTMKFEAVSELTDNELDAVTGGAAYIDTTPAPVYRQPTDAEIAVAKAWSVYHEMVRAGVF